VPAPILSALCIYRGDTGENDSSGMSQMTASKKKKRKNTISSNTDTERDSNAPFWRKKNLLPMPPVCYLSSNLGIELQFIEIVHPKMKIQ